MTGNNLPKFNAEPGKQDIIITMEFDAPHELVFKAYQIRNYINNGLGHEDSR